MPHKTSGQQDDIWNTIFNGLVEAAKMVLSVLAAIIVAGSKTVSPITPSAKSEDYNSGFRNGHGGPGYYDDNDQKLKHFDD